jgi:hypothetical protein
MKFLADILKKLKENKHYLCLLFSFALLYIYYYPAVRTDSTFYHLDDYYLISALAKITDFNSFLTFIFSTGAFKFRPVSYLQYFFEYQLFGNNLNFYILFNIFLVLIINWIFLLIIKDRLNFVQAVLFSSILVTSKFLNFSLWTIQGSFESLALIFFILIFYVLINFKDRLYLLSILGCLLIMASERYLPFVASIPVLHYFIHSQENLFISTIKVSKWSILIILMYVSLRFSLKQPLLVGTQTDNILSSFNPSIFLDHFTKSIGEILGFSVGPRYLTGSELPLHLNYSAWDKYTKSFLNYQIISVLLSIGLLNFNERKVKVAGIALLLMSLASSVTFRLEMRWLAPSYIMLLFIFSHANFEKLIKSLSFLRGIGNNLLTREKISKALVNVVLLYLLIFNIYYMIHLRRNLYYAEYLDFFSLSKYFSLH